MDKLIMPINSQESIKAPKYKVQLRGGFSDRNGINTVSAEMQIESLDERTRTCIINKIYEIYNQIKIHTLQETGNEWKEYYYNVLQNVYMIEISEFDYLNFYQLEGYYNNIMQDTIRKGEYDEVLTLIEYCVGLLKIYFPHRNPTGFDYSTQKMIFYDEKEIINNLFEKEYVGYRFVGEYIVQITDDEEIKAIEETLSSKFDGCKVSIKKAVGFLADRENKDYKNSIKESISAVEAICRIITNNSKATLGQALKKLEENGIIMHKALLSGFSSIYGYTSDEGGIRHSEGLFESNVTFEEAKYMLVSCCAFVNYLIAEYGKTVKG